MSNSTAFASKNVIYSQQAPEKSKVKIKEMSMDEQPRERLLRHGASTLSNAELLAVILRTGTNGLNVVDLCRQLIQSKGNLHNLSRAGWSDLKTQKGMGTVKAITLEAVFELGRRVHQKPLEAFSFKGPQDLYDYFGPMLSPLNYEVFYVILANHANKVIHYHRIAEGTKTATLVDVQRVIKLALNHEATGLILMHNHPSGNNRISQADKRLTQSVQEAASYFSLRVLDHIIVAGSQYVSFREEGLLV
jgi:DNA repair protein RadC